MNIIVTLSIVINILFIIHWAICKHDYQCTMQALEWKNNLADNMLACIIKEYNQMEISFLEKSAYNLCGWFNMHRDMYADAFAFIKSYETDRRKFIMTQAEKLKAQMEYTSNE